MSKFLHLELPSFAEEGDLLIGKVTHLDKPKLPDIVYIGFLSDGNPAIVSDEYGVKYIRVYEDEETANMS